MKNITEKKLIELDFKRQDEDSDQENPFYYYTIYIKDLCLITNTNDECVNNKWYVELCEYPRVGKFRDIYKLYGFIKILNSLRK
jgi:hypothetical protein